MEFSLTAIDQVSTYIETENLDLTESHSSKGK